MSRESLPAGPDRDAVVRTIRETYPKSDVVEIDGAVFFSLDAEKHWPNFATVVWTDEFDAPLERPSNLSARPGVYRLNVPLTRRSFELLTFMVASMQDPDYTALDQLLPHPVYAKQHWISVLNPNDRTFRDTLMPLIDQAHDRVAAVHARHVVKRTGGSKSTWSP